MKRIVNPTKEQCLGSLKRPEKESQSLEQTVAIVFDEVKSSGDRAVRKNTKQFDKVDLDQIEVTKEEIALAVEQVSKSLKNAIEIAKNNIEKFHHSQREEVKMMETIPGVTCWRESKAIGSVGLYIPGGTAPLFSTVLMLGVPAKIAGCKKIVLCSPPDKSGKIHPAILYAAQLCGITQVFKVGGIQAIAAMTFGTESIPRVSKIFGPGNQYVTAAKQYAMRKGIAIDMPAGPSEVLVLADDSADPSFVAADLLSQAEHGNDSQVILLCFSESFANAVEQELKQQLKELPRKDIAAAALENSKVIIVNSEQMAIDIVNEYAPEHLIISVEDEGVYLDEIENAGSVFLGKYTPESAGDYASGTNHTLPTNGYAKAYSGVSLDSFVKKITFQRISPKGLQALGPSIEIMAEAEELMAHKNAVSVRLKKLRS
ncbi:MAG: histidinol dehydrogenase [Flavobacteriales bacterium]|nr:histidinol dehydrogenase [Flavobacteriales bacterium]